jgi:hypothetical protein
MSYTTALEFTPEVVNLLATAVRKGIVDRDYLEEQIFKFQGGTKNQITATSAIIASGAITLTRTQQVMLISLDTEGYGPWDELDTINATGFYDGDEIYLFQANAARWILMTPTTGWASVDGRPFTLKRDVATFYSISHMVYLGGKFYEHARSPQPAAQTSTVARLQLATETVVVSSGYLTHTSSYVRAEGEYSGETRATAVVTVTAAGAEGDVISIWVNDGGPAYIISTYTVQSGDTIAQVVAGLVAAITLWSAAGASPAVNLTAPVGSGATPNSYTLSITASGTVAGTVTTQPNGGVSGTPQADTIDTIQGGVAGGPVVIQNANSSGDLTFSRAGNIVSARDIVVSPGESVVFIVDSSNVYRLLNVAAIPNETLWGYGKPASTLGSDGDSYIEYCTLNRWDKASGTWSISESAQGWEREIIAAYDGTNATIADRGALGSIVYNTRSYATDNYTNWTNLITSAVSGNIASAQMHQWCSIQQNPTTMLWIKWPNVITNQRIWAGITSSTSFGSTDTPAGEFAAIRFSTVAGDTKLMICYKGTGAQVNVDTGITPVSSRGYIFVFRFVNSSFYVDVIIPVFSSFTKVSYGPYSPTFTTTNQMITLASCETRAASTLTLGLGKIAGKHTI